MFFFLSKTITVLLVPSNLILLIGIIGIIFLLMRRRLIGLRLLVTSVVLLLAAGLFPLGSVLGSLLENRFPPGQSERTTDAPAGIIVLGGAIGPPRRGSPEVNRDAGRLVALAHLARAFPSARIIYSGGDGSLLGNEGPETEYVGAVLDDFGVPRSRVELESRSRNTAENAVFTKELAQPRTGERWLLVTSAQHMPRAIGAFRAVSFPVDAYPVAYQVEQPIQLWPRLAVGGNLAQLDWAVREWVGLIAYRATGRTSELLPAP